MCPPTQLSPNLIKVVEFMMARAMVFFFCCCESRPFVRSGNTLIFLARIAVSFPLLWWVVSPFVSIVTMVFVCATTERIFKSLHRASE